MNALCVDYSFMSHFNICLVLYISNQYKSKYTNLNEWFKSMWYLGVLFVFQMFALYWLYGFLPINIRIDSYLKVIFGNAMCTFVLYSSRKNLCRFTWIHNKLIFSVFSWFELREFDPSITVSFLSLIFILRV